MASRTRRGPPEARAAASIAPVVRMAERREIAAAFGRDASPPSLIKWRGESWGSYAWADVVGIMQQAEIAGATESWARLTRRMYQDGHILSVRGTRLDPISGADFTVAPGGPEPIDIRAAADCEAMLRTIDDMPSVLDAVLDAEFVGWSVQEIIWGTRGAWIWPSSIEPLEPHRFRFDSFIRPFLWDDGRLGNDPGANAQIRLTGKPLRHDKFIVHMPRTIPDYPIASGLLRACVRYWWVRWQAAQYWLQGAEVAGNPRAVGKYPQEAPDNVKQQFFDQLQQLSASGIMVMSKDNDLQILNASAPGSGSIWDGIQAWAEKGITQAVLGSTLNTDVGSSGGNRALGESQGSYTIDPRIKKSSASLWRTIQRDLLRPFLEFNRWAYGGAMPALPTVSSRFVDDMDPVVDDLIVSVGAVTKDDVRRSRGFTEWGEEHGGNGVASKESAAPMPAFGAALPADAEAAPDVQATALNGAQIASLQEILFAVQLRTMAPAAAKVAIRNAFPGISAADAGEMVDAQFTMAPAPSDEPSAPSAPIAPAVPMASAPLEPEAGQAWIDTDDAHRLRVIRVADGFVWFVDLDSTKPDRQWRWKEATFLERAQPPQVPASAPAGSLAIADAETTHATDAPGGASPASPFSPWDLAEKLLAEG